MKGGHTYYTLTCFITHHNTQRAVKVPDASVFNTLVRGTLRIRVQNSLFCMSYTSSTFYVELRSYHVFGTEAQQTLF